MDLGIHQPVEFFYMRLLPVAIDFSSNHVLPAGKALAEHNSAAWRILPSTPTVDGGDRVIIFPSTQGEGKKSAWSMGAAKIFSLAHLPWKWCHFFFFFFLEVTFKFIAIEIVIKFRSYLQLSHHYVILCFLKNYFLSIGQLLGWNFSASPGHTGGFLHHL